MDGAAETFQWVGGAIRGLLLDQSFWVCFELENEASRVGEKPRFSVSIKLNLYLRIAVVWPLGLAFVSTRFAME
jgi:hypothetical protein